MKRLLLSSLCIFLLISFANGQRNAQWVMGYNQTGVPNGFNDMFIMDFRTPVLSYNLIDTVRFSMDGTNASICDTAGNLLFYTNGVAVMNAQHDTMMNGAGLSPLSAPHYTNGHFGDIIPQGAIIIPHHSNMDLYYIIHSSYYTDINDPFIYDYYYCDTIYYSIVDISADNGNGAVILKNQYLWIGDVPSNNKASIGSLSSVKHANGRDWWLIFHKDSTDQFMTYLLTPQGFQGPYFQNIGPFIFEFKGQSSFSPDGSKYAFFGYGNTRIQLFDFDRCSGLFSNYFNITNINGYNIGSIGVSFSPNSRYLYTSSCYKIAQWDTYSANVSASKVVVAEIDSFPCPNYWNQFYLMKLAPDGKIYVSSPNSNHCFTVINNPDNGGLGCNAIPHGVAIPRSNATSVPNYPNYELGAIVGSPCDTITGINSHENKPINISCFPNPANEFLILKYPSFVQEGKLEIYNVLGSLVLTESVSPWSQSKKVELSDIGNGFYHGRISWGKEYGSFTFVVEE